MTESDYQYRTPAPDGPSTMDALGSAASDTAGTAKEQTRQVAGEVKAQARSLATHARTRMGAEVQGQNDRLAESLRHFAGELDDMVGDRDDSPARSVVLQVSQGGRRVADYLAEHGPGGVLREVQDFARRRPGTFLTVAAVAGFVAGRLGKGVLGAASADEPATPSSARRSSSTVGSDARPASVGYVPLDGDGYVQPVSANQVEPAAGGYVRSSMHDDARPVATGYAGSARPDGNREARR